MPPENSEVLKQAFEDAESVGDPEAILGVLSQDVIWEARADLPDAEAHRGHEAVRRLVASFEEILDDVWYRPVEFIDAPSDNVVVPLRWNRAGAVDGSASELEEVFVFTFEDGRVSRVREFAGRTAALEAAGLQE